MSAEKLEKLANTKFDLKAAKVNLLERMDNQLTFAYDGGLFKASNDLLAVLHSYQTAGWQEIVVLDVYQNPIKIKNVDLFTTMVRECIQAQLNEYMRDYNELKKVRKGDQL